MTKEELIELSDLNREDNIKYVSSEAQGIAITLDSDRYAPTLCKLERAYICGRRKSEEQIEELEKENAELKKERKRLSDNYHHWNIKACHIDQALYDTKRQLTNAKEIIREFMKYEINEYDGSLEIHFEELKKQAEQFLSEVEK